MEASVEIFVGAYDIILEDMESPLALHLYFISDILNQHVHQLRQAICARTPVYVQTEFILFHVCPMGNLHFFNSESCEHLMSLSEKSALAMLRAVKDRYLTGRVYFQKPGSETLCDDSGVIDWLDVLPFNKKSLSANDLITK